MTTTTDTLTAVLYARISQDDSGTEKGVGRQLDDARQLAQLRGFEVAGEYVENDVSAFSHRPEYERLMADVAQGGVDVIVVYSTSRLWRNRTQRGAAIDTLGRLGVRIEAVSGPSLDLSSATGRYLADVIAGGDTRESEEKGERVSRAAQQRAEEGRANGVCPYGWKRVYEHDDRGKVVGFHDVEHPEDAEVVREIVRRIADGDAIRGIARDLTDRGVPSPTGKPRWGHTSVRRTCLRPANIGKRTTDTRKPDGFNDGNVDWPGEPTPDKPYRGVIIGDAEWPAIVDETTWQRAIDRIGDHDPNPFAATGNDPEHLLTGKSGAGRCGVCGGPLRFTRRTSKRVRTEDRVYEMYTCQESGCVGRDYAKVNRLVRGVVVARLSKPDAAGAFVPPSDDTATAEQVIAETQKRLDDAAELYADGKITAAQMEKITSKLTPRIEAAKSDVRRAAARPTEPPVALDELAQADKAEEVWDDLDLEDRREVLHALGLTVKIMQTRPGPGFEPTDVHFEWGADA